MSEQRKKMVTFEPESCLEKLSSESQSKLLLEDGATLVLLDFPVGSEFGIDLNAWDTGPKFKGVKMIPPGKHFIYWSVVSKEGSFAPRTGFFHDFSRGELLAKRFEASSEDIVDNSAEDTERMKFNLRDLDPHLGPYPYESWKKWISLTNRISDATISRLEPLNGKIQSVTELIPEKHFTSRSSRKKSQGQGEASESPRPSTSESPRPSTSESPTPSASESLRPSTSTATKRPCKADREDERLPKMRQRPGTEIRYTPLPDHKYPEGSTPDQITKHSMDSSYQLEEYLDKFRRLYGDHVSSSMAHTDQTEEVLGELQFSFVCFLVGQHYDSFEHWKRLLSLFCSCDEAMAKHSELYMQLISDMHFQIREVPDDFFVDIVSNNNFLVSILHQLFSTAASNPEVEPRLKALAKRFETNLNKKFGWDFQQELEEDAPVIVDLEGYS